MTTSLIQVRTIATNKISVSLTLASALAIVLVFAPFAVPPAHAQTFSVIHTFTGSGGDGAAPEAGVTIRAGSLYGTTVYGGNGDAYGPGTVYQMTHVGSDWAYRDCVATGMILDLYKGGEA